MPHQISLQIPFESLVSAIAALSLEEKQQFVEMIEEAIFQEEDSLEQDPIVLAEIEEARKAYIAGDYQTIQEYVANRSSSAS